MTIRASTKNRSRAIALARANQAMEIVFEASVVLLACAALTLVVRAAGANAPLILLTMLAVAGPFAISVGVERRSLRAAALTGAGAVLAVTVMIPLIGLLLDGVIRALAGLMPA